MTSKPHLVSVIYWPNIDIIRKFASLASRGVAVCLVSNGCDAACRQALKFVGTKLTCMQNANNIGLAAAINQGLTFFLQTSPADSFVYVDQDSDPSIQLLENLIDCLENTEEEKVGAVAPQLIDIKCKRVETSVRGASTMQPMLSVPSSGTCFSRRALLDVGLMDEKLFIDGIDHEWCSRAKNYGYQVLRARHLEMMHDMGESGISVLGKYKPLYTNPLRHYYITRNTLLLVGRRYMPLKWRASELFKMAYRIPIYFLMSKNKKQSVRLIAQATRDAFMLKTGPLCYLTNKTSRTCPDLD